MVSDNFTNNTLSDLIQHKNFSWDIIWVIIVFYVLIIFIGVLFNSLILIVVIKYSNLRSPLHIFIWNLALSDCLLCLVTAPTTVIEICFKYWLFPNSKFLCKIIGMSQGLLIFASILTIVVIAVDRYMIMLHPNWKKITQKTAVVIVVIIWMVCFALVSPLFVVRDLRTIQTNNADLEYVEACAEFWKHDNGRAYYSIFSLVIQYILPIIILSFTYIKIYMKVKERQNVRGMTRKERIRQQRIRNTNSLLVAVALAQGISWLPLNLLNFIADVFENEIEDFSQFMNIFLICHVIGVFSSIIDPIIYGFYNESLRKKCLDLLCCMKVKRYIKKKWNLNEKFQKNPEGDEEYSMKNMDSVQMKTQDSYVLSKSTELLSEFKNGVS